MVSFVSFPYLETRRWTSLPPPEVPYSVSSLVLCFLVQRTGESEKRKREKTYHIRQHTSVTSGYVDIRHHMSAYVSIHQLTSVYVSICQNTSAYVRLPQHTSAHVSIRQHQRQGGGGGDPPVFSSFTNPTVKTTLKHVTQDDPSSFLYFLVLELTNDGVYTHSSTHSINIESKTK